MRIMFWNVSKNNDINPILSNLIEEKNINITVLAEYTADKNDLVNRLGKVGISMKEQSTIGCERINIFSDSTCSLNPGVQSRHYSVQIISNKFILCVVHLLSKLLSSNNEQKRLIIRKMIHDIEETENINNTESTILLGDYNLSPFDHECISAGYFNSIPNYDIASKKKVRNIQGEKYRYFYNPMWRFMGYEKIPYGTYYWESNDADNIFWYIFDQVMIRPCLKDYFLDDSLEIVTRTSYCSLLDRRGHPDKKKVSDHLPIIFEIKED